MLNHVTLLGRLALDPELKRTPDNVSVTKFDLAVNKLSRERDAQPDYIPVVCWKEQAENVCRFLTKGRQVVVEGRIGTRKYTDKDGKNRKAVEVIASRVHFVDNRNKDIGAEQAVPVQYDESSENTTDILATDDDLPF